MLNIKSFALGMLGTNCYLVSYNNDAVLIDPAAYSESVTEYIDKNNLNLKAILLTHAHFDHSLGAPEFASKFEVGVYVGAQDFDMLFDCTKDASHMANLRYKVENMPKVEKVYDNEVIGFGELQIKVISTPGHTMGGVCYYFENDNVLFSGDTLFFRSVGRTDLYGASFTELSASIKNKLYKLPDETKVYCGHSQPTQIGFEKVNNSVVWAE